MTPTYAVARRDFEPVEVELLAAALRGVPGLTPADAPNACGDGHGFLARRLEAEQAAKFLGNLQRAGVQAELVAEVNIPTLPTRRLIRTAELTSEALLVDDALGRLRPIRWPDVVLLAAGSVREAVFSRTRNESERMHPSILLMPHFAGVPIPVPETGVEYDAQESAEWALRAELLLADGTTRLSLEAERFSYAGLKEQLTQDLAANFCLLVRELVKRLPHATLNRGASLIAGEPWDIAYYDNRIALQNETTWLLWRRAAAASD